jgi:WD40 repeat protein
MLFEVNCHLCSNDQICLDMLSQQHAWNLFDFCGSRIVGHGYHTDGLTCLSITLDSQTVVSGSKDNSVHMVNVNSGQVGD